MRFYPTFCLHVRFMPYFPIYCNLSEFVTCLNASVLRSFLRCILPSRTFYTERSSVARDPADLRLLHLPLKARVAFYFGNDLWRQLNLLFSVLQASERSQELNVYNWDGQQLYHIKKKLALPSKKVQVSDLKIMERLVAKSQLEVLWFFLNLLCIQFTIKPWYVKHGLAGMTLHVFNGRRLIIIQKRAPSTLRSAW